MLVTARTLLLIALPCFAPSALAATVQRCEDANGNITFTSQGCSHTESMQSYEAYNAPPGSAVPLLPEANRSAPRTTGTAKKEVVVVGQRDDGCGNQVSSEQRRRAIINQRTLVGMSMRDVESALGKPDRIVNRSGETRYYYAEEKSRSNSSNNKGRDSKKDRSSSSSSSSSQIVFDENGCVKGKR